MRRGSTKRTATRATLLAAVCCAFVGCRTASGRALEGRLGGSLTRVWQSTTGLLGGEVTRGGRLLANPFYRNWRPQTRLNSLVASARTTLARTTDKIANMPRLWTGLPAATVRDSVQRVGTLVRRDSQMARQFEIWRLLARLESGVRRFMQSTTLARPILGGPGDPDRSTDPDVVRRRETWIERLLRRF